MPSFFARKPKKTIDEKPVILKWAGRFFMGIGIAVFISFLISSITLFSLLSGGPDMKPLPQDFVLVDEWAGARPDVSTVHPLVAEFIPQPTTLYSLLKNLKAAKDDERVTHLVVKIKDGDFPLSQIQSLRAAVIDFRSSGKKAIVYAENFGGFSNGLGEYWLATAFDEIWLNPLGIVSLMGVRVEQPFFKDALGKVGVEFEMEQRKDYKTGAEPYIRQTMSDENRETTKAIIDDIMQVVIGDISEGRSLFPQDIEKLINNAPILAEDALTARLVDRVDYLDVLEETLKWDDQDRKDMFVGMKRYGFESQAQTAKAAKKAKVAIVNIDGMIVDADILSKASHPLAFMMPDQMADPARISSVIRDVTDNDGIEVIVLRVNSPGGTPEAAEKIRRAVVKAKEKGKYIIASFSETAASGGYWVAVDADEIIAADLTITGSIGVYGGKPDLSGLWDMVGVNWDSIQYGDNAGMWTTNKGFDDGERRRLDAMMDHTYQSFVTRVAEGRNMSVSEAEEVAKGRAWTGLDALDIGLVDTLGGFEVALQKAAQKVEVDDWTIIPMVVMPQDEDPFDDLIGLLGLPSIAQIPKLPSIYLPAIFEEAVVTAPQIRIDF